MVGEYLMFFQNYTRSKFTIARNQLCSFTNLISQKFSDSAVILAKDSMQDFSVVRTQGTSSRFLFSYHSAIPENLFKGYFFTTRAEFGVVFSINFISSPAFLGFWKALEQGAMSSSVSAVGRRIVLNACIIWFSCMYNFISNIFFLC